MREIESKSDTVSLKEFVRITGMKLKIKKIAHFKIIFNVAHVIITIYLQKNLM